MENLNLFPRCFPKTLHQALGDTHGLRPDDFGPLSSVNGVKKICEKSRVFEFQTFKKMGKLPHRESQIAEDIMLLWPCRLQVEVSMDHPSRSEFLTKAVPNRLLRITSSLQRTIIRRVSWSFSLAKISYSSLIQLQGRAQGFKKNLVKMKKIENAPPSNQSCRTFHGEN